MVKIQQFLSISCDQLRSHLLRQRRQRWQVEGSARGLRERQEIVDDSHPYTAHALTPVWDTCIWNLASGRHQQRNSPARRHAFGWTAHATPVWDVRTRNPASDSSRRQRRCGSTQRHTFAWAAHVTPRPAPIQGTYTPNLGSDRHHQYGETLTWRLADASYSLDTASIRYTTSRCKHVRVWYVYVLNTARGRRYQRNAKQKQEHPNQGEHSTKNTPAHTR